MANKTIDEATHDTDVTGVEKIPMSDGGAAKYATVDDLKNFVIDKIEALNASDSFSYSQDSLYILKGGELKRATGSDVASAMLDYGFGLAPVAAMNGNEIFGIKDSTTKKIVTLTAIKNWLQNNMSVPASINFNDLETADAINTTDEFLINQSGNKKITIVNLSAYIHQKFKDYVDSLTAVQNVAGTDVLYVIEGSYAKKITLSQIKSFLGAGDTIAPESTTENKVPQWSSASKTLKDGLVVTTSIASVPEGTKLPTEGAVRTAITDACGSNGAVKAPSSTTSGKIPVWSNTANFLEDGKTVVTELSSSSSNNDVPTAKAVYDHIINRNGVAKDGSYTVGNVPVWSSNDKISSGYGVRTSVRNSVQADNQNLITEKAARDMADGFVSMPVSHVENAIPVWGAASELKAGKGVVTVLGSTGSNDNIPTEKAVRDAIPVVATTESDGLMSATDKTKLDGLADTGSVAEIGQALSDADTIVVKQTDVLYKKSLMTRFWAYILSKLGTVGIDTLGAATDITTLNSSTTAHGLMPKLDSSTDHFMRGDGTWATPSGSSDFQGTDGTSAGVHGLVPAPATTDVNKFLNANGTWATPPSAAGVDIPGATSITELAQDDLGYFYDVSSNSYGKVTAFQIAGLGLLGLKKYEEIFIPAGSMTPSNTNGATPGAITFVNTTHDTMAFPSSSDKSIEFSVVFPEAWDKLSVKAKILWCFYDSTRGESGQSVAFNLGAISYANSESISVAPSSSVTIVGLTQDANELCKSTASAAITIGGTVGNGNLVHFKLTRDSDYAPAGGTPLPTEAIVLGVIIQYGVTANMVQW